MKRKDNIKSDKKITLHLYRGMNTYNLYYENNLLLNNYELMTTFKELYQDINKWKKQQKIKDRIQLKLMY